MFDKFGEFDSAEEMNRAAAAQLKEGDTESILAIAKENGIDAEDAQDYIDGITGEFATPLMAAYGKLDIESAEQELCEIMEDWIVYIKVRCSESPDMAAAVRKKGKSLKGCLAALLKWSFANAREINGDITRMANVQTRYPLKVGVPGMRRARQIITDYYIGGEER